MQNKFTPRKELKKQIQENSIQYTTISFYKYFKISNLLDFQTDLYNQLKQLGILGRIYIAEEGINAQFSIPTSNLNLFQEYLANHPDLQNTPLKIAVEEPEKSFYKLTIKIRKQVLADGLEGFDYDPSQSGTHLNAQEFNQAIQEGATVIDMRNHYETEIGKFETAQTIDADTFRELLPKSLKIVENNKKQKILLYCTGGIRCEKASAYFKKMGFADVNQLEGGIIQYAHECKEKGLPILFKGKNFVFDERMGEKITTDILSNCHQCNQACDQHTNCKNDDCHLLFIQCNDCKEQMQNSCSKKCQEISNLPIQEQRELRKGNNKKDCLSVYKSRLRPKLSFKS